MRYLIKQLDLDDARWACVAMLALALLFQHSATEQLRVDLERQQLDHTLDVMTIDAKQAALVTRVADAELCTRELEMRYDPDPLPTSDRWGGGAIAPNDTGICPLPKAMLEPSPASVESCGPVTGSAFIYCYGGNSWVVCW